MCIAHNYANTKHDPKLTYGRVIDRTVTESVYINEIKLVTENPPFL